MATTLGAVRRIVAFTAVVIGLSLSATQGLCEPVVLGSQGFLSLAGVAVDGTNNGNINTGTSFVVQTLATTASGTGYFAFSGTSGPQFFSNVTINTSSPLPSPLFSSASFGTFSPTSIVEETSSLGFRSFLVLGNFVGGTLGGPVTPSPSPAEFRISFTQTGGAGSTITSNATMALIAVPEPTTLTLLGIGAVAMGGRLVRRRPTAAGGLTTEPRRQGWHRGETGRRCR